MLVLLLRQELAWSHLTHVTAPTKLGAATELAVRFLSTNMPKPLRQLAPKEPSSPNGKDGAEQGQPLTKRRVPVKIACAACRRRKVSCDGQLPGCARCLRARTVCVYRTTGSALVTEQLAQVQKDLADHTDVIEHLWSAPEDESLSVLRRLRATRNIGAVLSRIRNSYSHTRPSALRAARGVLPPTPTEIEFELAMLHKYAYPVLEPIDLVALDPHVVDEDVFPAIPKPLAGAATSEPGAPLGAPSHMHTVRPQMLGLGIGSALPGSSSETSPSTFGPPKPLPYCDARLSRLNIGFWTKVPISNELAASAISRYLETDHAVTGFFDADLFIEDLVELRFSYCSSFLVSALLSLACLYYTSWDSRAAALSRFFLREADHLRSSYCGSDSTIALSALMVNSTAAAFHRKEILCRSLLAEGRAMAERLRLFGAPTISTLVEKFTLMSAEQRSAASHAAWGCYGLVTHHCTFFHETPIAYPPMIPAPGEEDQPSGPSSNARQPSPISMYTGRTFAAVCKLWAITQEVVGLYSRVRERALSEVIPFSFAQEKFQKLLAWSDTFTDELSRNIPNPDHVYIFHIMYHVLVLDIFRPFIDVPEQLGMRSFSSSDSSPTAVFDASSRQLGWLLYYTTRRSNTKHYSAWVNPAAMHVCNVALATCKDRNWRLYFTLSMDYWMGLIPSYPVLADVAQGYLSLAVRNGVISFREARKWKDWLDHRNRHCEADESASSAIVDFNAAITTNQNYRANELVQQFDELALFEEFTDSQKLENPVGED